LLRTRPHLGDGALCRILVRAEPQEARPVPTPLSLPLVVADLDHELRGHGAPLERDLRTPAAGLAARLSLRVLSEQRLYAPENLLPVLTGGRGRADVPELALRVVEA